MVKNNEKPTPVETPKEYYVTGDNKFWKKYTDKDFQDYYDNIGLAFKATERFAGDLFSDNFDTKNSTFESIRKELDMDDVLRYAGVRAFVDGWCLVYLGFNDSGDFEDPVRTKQKPDYFWVIPKSWVVEDINYNYEGRDYYKIGTQLPNGAHKTFKLHESRVVRLQYRKDGKSMLLPGMRSFTVHDNILWSVGQSYFRNAAGFVHLKVENPITTTDKDGNRVTEIQQIKQDGFGRNINSETSYVSSNRHELDFKQTGNIPNPQPYWEVSVQASGMSVQIPYQLLIGANAGAVSGSETNIKEYFAQMQKLREVFVTKLLNVFADKFGLPKLEPSYGTLFEETDLEKAEMYEKDAKTMDLMIRNGTFSRESVLEHLNNKYETKFTLGEVQQSGLTISQGKNGDSIKIIGKDDVVIPEMKSKWEQKRFQNFIKKIEDDIVDTFEDSINFPNIEKNLKGSIHIRDTVKNMRLEYKPSSDAEKEAKIVIEQVVEGFDKIAKLKFVEYIGKAFKKGWKLGEEETGKSIEFTDRITQIEAAITDDVMDLVTGASEDMKKDLKRELVDALKNEQSIRQAAKRFREYVDEDFANKYKRRLMTIARNETMQVMGRSNYISYGESGVVDYLQWITAEDDRVRPEHRKVHGEVRKYGEKFSLGVTYAPHGILCRCCVVPYFGAIPN